LKASTRTRRDLEKSKLNLVVSLERNAQLEKGMVRVKKELNKLLKWTTYSKMLASLTSKGLRCRKLNPPYNPHSKYACDLRIRGVQN